jgi:N6-adenosine-specific RNA methylase IME4
MKKYSSIIADPPWAYRTSKALVGNGGRGFGGEGVLQVGVDNHYPSLTTDSLCSMGVAALCRPDATLFLWTTNSFLANGDATRVVTAWGFTPKTVLTWAKCKEDGSPSMKTGHWFRGATEHVIFATRGKPRRPEHWEAIPTWFPHTRMPHSVKPPLIHRYAEESMPRGPWLELFARRPFPGWDTWGNEQSTINWETVG